MSKCDLFAPPALQALFYAASHPSFFARHILAIAAPLYFA